MSGQVKGDVRVAFTRSQITAAMIELLKEKPPAQISVSELCKQADVSRPTFYQYFKSPDDVLAAALEDRLARVTEAAEAAARTERSEVPAVIARFLDALWHDRFLYRAALQLHSPYGYSRSVMETWLQQSLLGYLRTHSTGPLPDDIEQRVLFATGGIVTGVAKLLARRGLSRPDFTAFGVSLWASVERVMGP